MGTKRIKGKITKWSYDKGFGFITPQSGGKQIFIHISEFGNRNLCPVLKQSVTYDLSRDKLGRPCAVNATLPGDKPAKKLNPRNGLSSVIFTVFFFAIICIAVFAGKLSPLILVLYVIVSPLTFIIYAADKSAAQKGEWRTPESTLHILSLFGGWPGALVAQQKLRHKSVKLSFRFVFWLTVLLNCGALAWLFTPNGAAAMQALIFNIS